mgnify:CR=1 FL=1
MFKGVFPLSMTKKTFCYTEHGGTSLIEHLGTILETWQLLILLNN